MVCDSEEPIWMRTSTPIRAWFSDSLWLYPWCVSITPHWWWFLFFLCCRNLENLGYIDTSLCFSCWFVRHHTSVEMFRLVSAKIWRAFRQFLYARLQTGRIMVWWCPSVRPSIRPSVRHSFPHFSLTCFDILIWNVVYHFIFMHVRSSSNAINFRHFLQELCSFLTSNSYKYAVFRTFLLHALTYWVQFFYMTLF